MDAIIVVDAGTTSIRSVLCKDDGTLLHLIQKELAPISSPEGYIEQDAKNWITVFDHLLCSSMAHASSNHINILAVALTSFRSAVVPVDSNGTPLHRVIMWQDTRTDAWLEQFSNTQEEIFSHTGATITSMFSAPKIVWLLEHMPDLKKRTTRMVGIMDLFVHHLTGRFVTDSSCACRSSLMNIVTRRWDPWLLDLFHIDESLLPEIVEPGSIVGTVNENASRLTSLEEGIPVIISGGDQQCAALGNGLTGIQRMVSNTGTGSYVVSYSENPLLDSAQRVFCVPSAIPMAYHLEASMKTTGSVYRWFASLCTPSGDMMDFSQLDALAVKIPPGADGVVLIPHFQGSGSPFWAPSANGLLSGLSLGTGHGHIARAILEGIAIEIARNTKILEEMGISVNTLVSSGGMSRSSLFNRILSDITGKIIEQPKNCEATAIGAWINAVVTLGMYPDHASAYGMFKDKEPPSLYTPNTDNQRVYSELMKKTDFLIKSTAPGKNVTFPR